MPSLRPAAFAATALLLGSEPAYACRYDAPLVLDDVRSADLVVVGRIKKYRKLRNYARFSIDVREFIKGNGPSKLIVTWNNSTFGEPDKLPSGPFLIALRWPNSKELPLRGPSATVFRSPEPDVLTVLQAPCSRPFIFESRGAEAVTVRSILSHGS